MNDSAPHNPAGAESTAQGKTSSNPGSRRAKPPRRQPDLGHSRLADWSRILHDQLLRLMRAEAARSADAAAQASLLDWARHYLREHFTRGPSRMHLWLAERFRRLESERQRGLKLNVLGPRGGAKSTVVTLAWVLKLALEGREPYIWIISDSMQQAARHLDNLKQELLGNPRLAADYPHLARPGPVWRRTAIQLAHGVTIEAFGTGQRIRGRRRAAHRPSLIVCDDLQNDQHIQSAACRQQTRTWFHGTLLNAGTKQTNIVNLATALHREALALELARTPGWTSRVFRAIEQWPTEMTLWQAWEEIYTEIDAPDCRQRAREFYLAHQAAMEAGAVLLWPDEEDLYTLMCLRAQGGRATFEREKQGSPANPDLCEFPEEYFQEHVWFDEWPRELLVKTLALDPSQGRDDQRGDFSAFVLLGVDPRGVIHVEADLARRPAARIVADGVELCRRFRPHAFGIESCAFQELLGHELQSELERQGLLTAPVSLLDNRVNKRVRIRRLGPYLAARRLRFKRNSPSTQLLVNQLRDFPIADHDDGPDAAEMALRLAQALQEAAPQALEREEFLPL